MTHKLRLVSLLLIPLFFLFYSSSPVLAETPCAQGGPIDSSTTGKIAFVSDRDKQVNVADTQIYLINPDGSGLVRLCVPMHASNPRWSPDGTKLSLVVRAEGGDNRIAVMDADGSNLTILANGEFQDWSPDGTKMVFMGRRTLPGTGGIFVMNSDGSNITRLTIESNFYDDHPRWSPAGDKIAFERMLPETNSEIYVMNTDGTDVVNISNTQADDRNPSWSPDGTKLAYVYMQQIFVMNADGSNKVSVHDDSVNPTMVNWSPDSQQFVFEMVDRESSCCNNEIWTMNVDGTNLQKITTDPASDDQAVWSLNAPWSWTPPAPEIAVSESNSDLSDGSSFNFGTTPEGTPITKTFTVKNTGFSNLVLSDLSVSGDFSIEANFGNAVVAPNGSTTFQIRMDATSPGSKSGLLSFTNNDADENPFNLTVNGEVTLAADLAVSIVDLPDPVRKNHDVTYIVNTANLGASTATGVTLSVTLPDNVRVRSISSSQGTCTEQDDLITCNLGSIAKDSTASVTIVAKLKEIGTFTTTADASGIEHDPNMVNNTATEDTTVAHANDLSRLKVNVHGHGFVSSNPWGINCPSDCAAFYFPDTSVTLTATPDSGWEFIGWEGACQRVGSCTVNLSTDLTARAIFRRQ